MEPEVLGKYVLTERLGSGGMAEVFLAHSSGPGGFQKSVALKRILPQLAADPEFVDMFVHEARVAARLDHPNIAQIHELGCVDGTWFIAMELVDGPSLRALCERAQPAGAVRAGPAAARPHPIRHRGPHRRRRLPGPGLGARARGGRTLATAHPP